MKKPKLISILSIVLFAVIGGCSKKPSNICGTKEVEQELIKRAVEQDLIPKALAGKASFTVMKIEQSSPSLQSNEPRAETVCVAEGKLEYVEEIQKSYAEIKKFVGENFPFAKNYFSDDLSSFKIISYKVKKNQLNNGVIVDGEWIDKRSNGEPASELARQLPSSVLQIIEKKEKIYSDLRDVAQIYDFRTFILDKKNDIARPGRQVRDYILNNKIPVLQCVFFKFKFEDHFDCRIAGERAAFNITLSFEDSNQVISEVFDGKPPPEGVIVRDERIEQLLSRAKFVWYADDSFKVFKVAVFSEMEHITIK
jgi:hypothetical protein